jgi:hypothetical protein
VTTATWDDDHPGSLDTPLFCIHGLMTNELVGMRWPPQYLHSSIVPASVISICAYSQVFPGLFYCLDSLLACSRTDPGHAVTTILESIAWVGLFSSSACALQELEKESFVLIPLSQRHALFCFSHIHVCFRALCLRHALTFLRTCNISKNSNAPYPNLSPYLSWRVRPHICFF